jgi:aminoglycoside/choline kinase family phosphotransferase
MTRELIERVTRRFNEDQANQTKAINREDIPISYELITVEWLTAVLCGDHPGAKVVAFRLGERDSGTSARRRIYLEYNSLGQQASLPRTSFAKSSQELIHRISYAVNGSTNREADFYNIVRPLLTIEGARSYFANYDLESCNSIVLLEDLEGYASFCDEHTSISRDQAIEMTLLMADIHTRFSAPESLAIVAGRFPTWQEHWANISSNGMEEYTNKGFLAAEQVIPRKLFTRYSEVWPRTMDSIRAHDDLPPTFNHGDTHLSNWYRTSDARMGLSDWQGAVVGHWSRDVVYAYSTALSIENRRAFERDLLSIYLDRVRANGVEPPRYDQAFKWYRQQSLSALAYWTVTYTPSPGMPENMQPKDRTLAYIDRLSHAANDLEALDSFD